MYGTTRDVRANKSNSDDELNESTTSRKSRMGYQDEEIFIRVIVEKFDIINDTSTARGTPGSSSVKERAKKINEGWAKICDEVNSLTGISDMANQMVHS